MNELLSTADELASLRKAFGYTQSQMADAMGLSRRAYIDVESGLTFRKRHQTSAIGTAVERVLAGEPIIAPVGISHALLDLLNLIASVAKTSSGDHEI